MHPAEPTKLSRADEAFIALGLLLSALGLGFGMAYWADQKAISRAELRAAVMARQCVLAVAGTEAEAQYRCDLPVPGTYVSGALLLEKARSAD